jgi:hypothetical protein
MSLEKKESEGNANSRDQEKTCGKNGGKLEENVREKMDERGIDSRTRLRIPSTILRHIGKCPSATTNIRLTRVTVFAYTRLNMSKYKLTLTVDPALLEKIKIQAVKDKRSVSDITEELWREYLKRGKAQK